MYKSLERGPVELRPFVEECSNLVSIESTNKIRAIKVRTQAQHKYASIPRFLAVGSYFHP